MEAACVRKNTPRVQTLGLMIQVHIFPDLPMVRFIQILLSNVLLISVIPHHGACSAHPSFRDLVIPIWSDQGYKL
jgi:hypothetical protein